MIDSREKGIVAKGDGMYRNNCLQTEMKKQLLFAGGRRPLPRTPLDVRRSAGR
ncbi:hypothetical protein RUM43_004418, partial [Polyplax serrata]